MEPEDLVAAIAERAGTEPRWGRIPEFAFDSDDRMDGWPHPWLAGAGVGPGGFDRDIREVRGYVKHYAGLAASAAESAKFWEAAVEMMKEAKVKRLGDLLEDQ